MRIMFRKCNNEKCKKRRNDNKVIQVNEKIKNNKIIGRNGVKMNKKKGKGKMKYKK